MFIYNYTLLVSYIGSVANVDFKSLKFVNPQHCSIEGPTESVIP